MKTVIRETPECVLLTAILLAVLAVGAVLKPGVFPDWGLFTGLFAWPLLMIWVRLRLNLNREIRQMQQHRIKMQQDRIEPFRILARQHLDDALAAIWEDTKRLPYGDAVLVFEEELAAVTADPYRFRLRCRREHPTITAASAEEPRPGSASGYR